MPGKIMFNTNTYAFSFLLLVLGTACAEDGLTVALDDPAWNGKNIPTDQVCKKFSGNQGKSPALKVKGIPADADALVLSFNDESYSPMDKGGHGVVRIQLNKASAMQVQSIPGETDTLPAGVSVVINIEAPAGVAPAALICHLAPVVAAILTASMYRQ